MFLPAGKFDEAMQNKTSARRAIQRLPRKGTAIARALERVSKLRSAHPLFKVIITTNFLYISKTILSFLLKLDVDNFWFGLSWTGAPTISAKEVSFWLPYNVSTACTVYRLVFITSKLLRVFGQSCMLHGLVNWLMFPFRIGCYMILLCIAFLFPDQWCVLCWSLTRCMRSYLDVWLDLSIDPECSCLKVNFDDAFHAPTLMTFCFCCGSSGLLPCYTIGSRIGLTRGNLCRRLSDCDS